MKYWLRNFTAPIAFLSNICYNLLYSDKWGKIMTFADKVKHVRMKLYLSQMQLAKEIGVSFATVNRWENQGIEPRLAQLGKFNDFCEKHHISFDEKGNAHNG